MDPDKATLVAMETTIETEIQDVVEGLMPELPPGEDPFPLVRVAAYHDAKIESPPGPSLAETTMYWFGSHWQTIGLFLMSIAGLLMVRSMIRSAAANMSAAASEEQVEAPEPAASEDDEDDQDDDITNSLRARFQASGRSLRDELTELVREDPDAAANVLQNWIGEAA